MTVRIAFEDCGKLRESFIVAKSVDDALSVFKITRKCVKIIKVEVVDE